MNWKIALTAALLISGGAFTTQAQQKAAVTQAQGNAAAKAFLAKASEFETGDATKSAAALETLKTNMMAGISSSKDEMSRNEQKGNAAEAATFRSKHQARVDLYNRLVQLSKVTPVDKKGAMYLLQQYAKTL